jgi:hypothetical protein
MTVHRPLIGLDPLSYQAVRLGQESDQQLLLVRANRITGLLTLHRADSLGRSTDAAELRRVRRENASLGRQLTEQEVRTERVLNLPMQKPFLFDKNTWIAAGAAFLGGLIFGATHK